MEDVPLKKWYAVIVIAGGIYATVKECIKIGKSWNYLDSEGKRKGLTGAIICIVVTTATLLITIKGWGTIIT